MRGILTTPENKQDKTIARINGVNNLVNDYAAFLVDAWGVVHDDLSPEQYEYLFRSGEECWQVLFYRPEAS